LLNAHVRVETLPGTSFVWAYFPCDGLSCRSRLYQSSDWGRVWRLVGYPQLLRLRFFSSRDGWGLTNRYVLVATHDGGRSWRRFAKQPCPPDNPIGVGVVALAPVSSRRGWVLCSDGQMFERAVAVYETRDGARSWRLRAKRDVTPRRVGRGALNLVALLDVFFSPDGRGWIWRWGRPLRTPDGGRSWRPVAGWPFSPKTSAVTWGSAVSDTLAFAVVGRRGRPTVLVTTSNGGRSWAIVRRWPHS
jgi:photosystem II stability/assembly factor-like uncharacterized protein